MNSQEKDMQSKDSKELQKSSQEGENEIQQLGSQVLTKIFDSDESGLENICIVTAQRLSNVAHSLIEEQEKNYLNNENSVIGISHEKINSTIALCQESREQLKMALQIKSERTKLFNEFLKANK